MTSNSGPKGGESCNYGSCPPRGSRRCAFRTNYNRALRVALSITVCLARDPDNVAMRIGVPWLRSCQQDGPLRSRSEERPPAVGCGPGAFGDPLRAATTALSRSPPLLPYCSHCSQIFAPLYRYDASIPTSGRRLFPVAQTTAAPPPGHGRIGDLLGKIPGLTLSERR